MNLTIVKPIGIIKWQLTKYCSRFNPSLALLSLYAIGTSLTKLHILILEADDMNLGFYTFCN